MNAPKASKAQATNAGAPRQPRTRTSPPPNPTADPQYGQSVNPTFRMVFLSVLAITVLCLIAVIAMAIFARDTDSVKSAEDTCATAFKMGVGAILGLLAGRQSPTK